jgi:hypothetical protein
MRFERPAFLSILLASSDAALKKHARIGTWARA